VSLLKKSIDLNLQKALAANRHDKPIGECGRLVHAILSQFVGFQ